MHEPCTGPCTSSSTILGRAHKLPLRSLLGRHTTVQTLTRRVGLRAIWLPVSFPSSPGRRPACGGPCRQRALVRSTMPLALPVAGKLRTTDRCSATLGHDMPSTAPRSLPTITCSLHSVCIRTNVGYTSAIPFGKRWPSCPPQMGVWTMAAGIVTKRLVSSRPPCAS